MHFGPAMNMDFVAAPRVVVDLYGRFAGRSRSPENRGKMYKQEGDGWGDRQLSSTTLSRASVAGMRPRYRYYLAAELRNSARSTWRRGRISRGCLRGTSTVPECRYSACDTERYTRLLSLVLPAFLRTDRSLRLPARLLSFLFPFLRLSFLSGYDIITLCTRN